MDISFERTSDTEARIVCDDDWIGGLYRQPDILKPGSHYYVVHLFDDPRGPIRLHDRAQVRKATEDRAASLPHLQGGVEEDAERYRCEDCGAAAVYGSAQLLMCGLYHESNDEEPATTGETGRTAE